MRINHLLYAITILFFGLQSGQQVFAQQGDPFGAAQKKVLLRETIEKLTQKSLPNSKTSTDVSTVFVFLLSHTNTAVRFTKPFPIHRYADGTWPFAKEVIKNYAQTTASPIDRVKLIGYFNSVNDAEKEWENLSMLTVAYGLRGQIVAFDTKDALKPFDEAPRPTEGVSNQSKKNAVQSGIRRINLPDAVVKGRDKITLGIMPIIDSASNLSQQFAIYQFLHDNPIVINGKDTLHATITDTRTFTYFAISGTVGEHSYKLKLWQKDKLLAEINYDFSTQSYRSRLLAIGEYVGKVVGQDNFALPRKLNYKNIYDNSGVILSEHDRDLYITSLFPDQNKHYIPVSASLQLAELFYLNPRISNKGFDIDSYDDIKGAQLIRAVYQQNDNRLFFIKNHNVPDNIKTSVKKLIQPSSRRLGAALSYISIGLDSKSKGELDVAASCFYSALLLANNLAASVYEKAWVKRTVYKNMAEIYRKRNQPLLASMFVVAADLNDSFLKSDMSKLAHVEYYRNIEKLAESCVSIENSAQMIQVSKSSAIWLGVLSTAITIDTKGGLGNLSYSDIASISNQFEAATTTSQQSSLALREVAEDVSFSSIEARDGDGVSIELNQLYLAREIMSHILLRSDQEMVARQLGDFIADKPNLLYYLEEAYAEEDKTRRNQALDELLDHFRMIETQGVIYESRGRQVPATKTKQF